MRGPDLSDWSADLALIRDAARAAGAIALGFFRQSPEVWWKNEGRSPVSAADFAANESLERQLRGARPDYGWLSEETDDDAARLSTDTQFVVDPIDGTRAFIGGLETWCVSVAVVHRGNPVAGVLFAPALEEEFAASLATPALKNDRPIRVAGPPAGRLLRLASSGEMVADLNPVYRATVERVSHVPSLAYRIAMVADGSIDGTLVRRGSHDWDLAAADLILAQAGGSLVDVDGARLVYNRADVTHSTLCAATSESLPALLRNLRRT